LKNSNAFYFLVKTTGVDCSIFPQKSRHDKSKMNLQTDQSLNIFYENNHSLLPNLTNTNSILGIGYKMFA